MKEKIKIGTCAWSFEDWRGNFYPEHLPHNQWLEYYARFLSAVEVDSTFYHAPTASTAGHWLDRTPDHFCFACKMPREITHDRRLRDCEAQVDAFLEAIAPLSAKLGCVLIQLPPNFTLRNDEAALKHFVMRLPRDFRFAIEFRHTDWHLPRIAHLLEENRVCSVWSDTSPLDRQTSAPFEFLPQTTDFLYVRLLGDLRTKYQGDGSRIHRYGSLMWPRDSAIESWGIKIGKHLAESSRVYLFANNHFEGSSPETCRRLAKELGIEIPLPVREDLKTPEPMPDPQLDLL